MLVEDMQYPHEMCDRLKYMPLLINEMEFECLYDIVSFVHLIPMKDAIENNFRPDLSQQGRQQPRTEPGGKV